MRHRGGAPEVPATPLWPATLFAGVVVIGVLAGVAVLNSCLEARQEAVAEGESDATVAELSRRIAVVEAELERHAGRPAWAGCWYAGDGLGMNVTLWLAPESGCVASWTGCLGLYGANWGAVRDDDGVLRVAFERPNDADGIRFPVAYVFERTAEGRSLQGEDELADLWTFRELRDDAREPTDDARAPLEFTEPIRAEPR